MVISSRTFNRQDHAILLSLLLQSWMKKEISPPEIYPASSGPGKILRANKRPETLAMIFVGQYMLSRDLPNTGTFHRTFTRRSLIRLYPQSTLHSSVVYIGQGSHQYMF